MWSFAEVDLAYKCLSDPERRALYDASGSTDEPADEPEDAGVPNKRGGSRKSRRRQQEEEMQAMMDELFHEFFFRLMEHQQKIKAQNEGLFIYLCIDNHLNLLIYILLFTLLIYLFFFFVHLLIQFMFICGFDFLF
jgi:DnaJ-class molecular chaperone